MGKVVRIQKSRKEWKCSKCGTVIAVGEPYLKGELNFSKPIIRCTKCGLEHWEVTTSDYQLEAGAILYHWRDNYEVSEEGRDGLVMDLETISDNLQDRLDSMPEGLQQGDTGVLLQERIDYIQSAIDELEGIDFDEEDEDFEQRIEDALNCIEL